MLDKKEPKARIKQVKLSKKTNEQLTELSDRRKDLEMIIKSKQDIVAYLVDRLHQKECKQ